MSSVFRRRILHAGSVGLTLGMAGCSRINPFVCSDHRAVVVRTEPTGVAPANPILFDDLRTGQQSILRTALEDDEYRECPYSDAGNREALSDLASTVTDHTTEDQTAYLEYRDEYYTLSVRIQDQVYSYS